MFYYFAICRFLARIFVTPSVSEGPGVDAARPSLTLLEVARFASKIRPKAVIHRSLGHRPRNANRNEFVWPKAIIIFDANDT